MAQSVWGSIQSNSRVKLAETGRFDVIEIANGYNLHSQAIEYRNITDERKNELADKEGDDSVMVC